MRVCPRSRCSCETWEYRVPENSSAPISLALLSGSLSRRSEAVALVHGLSEALPLFRSHPLTTAVPAAPLAWAMASQSAEQNPAQGQQSQRLPEAERS